MFKKYAELIKIIFEGITSNESRTSFMDYVQVIGYTLGIMLTVFLTLLVIFIMMKGPIMLYTKLKSKYINIINVLEDKVGSDTEIAEADKTAYNKAQKSLFVMKRNFILGMIFVYLPLTLPTLLIFIDMILKILK